MSPPILDCPASCTSLVIAHLVAGIWLEHGGEGGLHQRAAQGCPQAAPGRAGAGRRQGRLAQPPQRCHPGTVPCLHIHTYITRQQCTGNVTEWWTELRRAFMLCLVVSSASLFCCTAVDGSNRLN